jgi:hypothetical protein
MLQSVLRHGVRQIAVGVVALTILLPSVVSAQTPTREGNDYDFRSWQPTRGGDAAKERAAGISQSPEQRREEDKELSQINKDLLGKNAPLSPTQPGAPK